MKQTFYQIMLATCTGKIRNAACYFSFPYKITDKKYAVKCLQQCRNSEYAKDGEFHHAMGFYIEKVTIAKEQLQL